MNNRGTNYTRIFDDMYTDRFLYVFEVKRKDKIFLFLIIELIVFMTLLMLLSRLSIPFLSVLVIIFMIFVVLGTIVGIGFDVDDIPAYKYVINQFGNTKRVRIAGKTYYPKKPHKIIIRNKFY